MPTVIVHHDIKKDTKHWLDSPRREEVFGPARRIQHSHLCRPAKAQPRGLADGHCRHGPCDGLYADPGGRHAMEHDGVVPESLVFLIEL